MQHQYEEFDSTKTNQRPMELWAVGQSDIILSKHVVSVQNVKQCWVGTSVKELWRTMGGIEDTRRNCK